MLLILYLHRLKVIPFKKRLNVVKEDFEGRYPMHFPIIPVHFEFAPAKTAGSQSTPLVSDSIHQILTEEGFVELNDVSRT